MELFAEFDISCPALPLVDVARAVPEATIQLKMQYNHGRRPPFVVTVTHDDQPAVERAFETSEFVDRSVHLGTAGETSRYQIEPARSETEQLSRKIDDLDGLRALASANATIERIEVTPTGWRQSGWFADRKTVEAFVSFWNREGAISVQRLTPIEEAATAGDGLTDPQHEALRVAYERGYFAVPRETTLEAIAAELDIAPSSCSERLRRAQKHLLETTIGTSWPPLPR
ncbi:helix-turn-helix domain-containing protein [Halocatena halophila]|uniref:helix-turn-helix domain-containing protein n=1 Tax=Halocatena halophila TaxID=2814576 RepID=UPI002ED67337